MKIRAKAGGQLTERPQIANQVAAPPLTGPCLLQSCPMPIAVMSHAYCSHVPCLLQSYPMPIAVMSHAYCSHVPCVMSHASCPMPIAVMSHAYCGHVPCLLRSCPMPIAANGLAAVRKYAGRSTCEREREIEGARERERES